MEIDKTNTALNYNEILLAINNCKLEVIHAVEEFARGEDQKIWDQVRLANNRIASLHSELIAGVISMEKAVEQIKEMEGKVEKIEKIWFKISGAFILLQSAGGAIFWLLK